VESLGLSSCRLEEGHRGVVRRSRDRAGYRLEGGVCGIGKLQRWFRDKYRIG
jgi:hypothetical protein